jgi:hypothetical protein
MEQWGSGIQRMTAACREAGLPPPSRNSALDSASRFRTIPVDVPSVDPIDQTILDAVGAGGGSSTAEVAAILALTPRATRTRLAKLVGRGAHPRDWNGSKRPTCAATFRFVAGRSVAAVLDSAANAAGESPTRVGPARQPLRNSRHQRTTPRAARLWGHGRGRTRTCDPGIMSETKRPLTASRNLDFSASGSHLTRPFGSKEFGPSRTLVLPPC